MQACSKAAKSVSTKQVVDKIFPLVKLCVRIGVEHATHSSMLSLYSALLTDLEREVKAVACSDLSKLCTFVGAAAFKPALLSLSA